MSPRRVVSFPFGIGRAGFLAILLWISPAPIAVAQGEASIGGRVADSSGGAVPGAAVRIKNLETGAERGLGTDEAGRYEAPALGVGRYAGTVESPGFRSESGAGVWLGGGRREPLGFALRLGAVA